ncbi:MAG: hypothetical protein LAN64_13105 [Acidobacteriia bacterium]|nr:hypothetical protein [Terriglobia bacterium]
MEDFKQLCVLLGCALVGIGVLYVVTGVVKWWEENTSSHTREVVGAFFGFCTLCFVAYLVGRFMGWWGQG